jgi:histidinol-phosphate aminotransferase
MTREISGSLRKGIIHLERGTAGLSLEEVKRKYGVTEIVKLASNENPLGPSPKAIHIIKEAAGTANIYPDPTGHELRSVIANEHGVEVAQVLHGNGSGELITFIGEVFVDEGDECIIPVPTYHRYQEVFHIMGAKNVFSPLKDYRIDLEDIRRRVTPKTKIVVLVNPNNPTGDIVRGPEVRAFLEGIGKDTIVVFDEAYGEFVEDEQYPRAIELMKEGYNVIALRTFSKAYGLAGVRLGYAVSKPEIIGYLNAVRHVFNVNKFAQFAGIEAMKDKEHLGRCLQLIWDEKAYYYEQLDRLGLFYVPTSANFIFVDTGVDDLKLSEALVKRGIVIRPMTQWGYKGCVRITIGTHYQNEKALTGLREALGELKSEA